MVLEIMIEGHLGEFNGYDEASIPEVDEEIKTKVDIKEIEIDTEDTNSLSENKKKLKMSVDENLD